jgi:hypothetical protein
MTPEDIVAHPRFRNIRDGHARHAAWNLARAASIAEVRPSGTPAFWQAIHDGDVRRACNIVRSYTSRPGGCDEFIGVGPARCSFWANLLQERHREFLLELSKEGLNFDDPAAIGAAVRVSSPAIFDWVLRFQSSLSTPEYHWDSEVGLPPALLALVLGKEAKLARLLASGADLRSVHLGTGLTLLHAAVILRRDVLVMHLVDKGVNPDAEDAAGMSAREFARRARSYLMFD